MEEIDIIELLKRVKEGKEPKRIEVKGIYYEYQKTMKGYFRSVIDSNYISLTADFDMFDILDTKIKILDKPIIEEIKFETDENLKRVPPSRFELTDKINEIIRVINKENKDE